MKQHEVDVRDIFDEMMLEIQNNFMTKTDGESEPEKVKSWGAFCLVFSFFKWCSSCRR